MIITGAEGDQDPFNMAMMPGSLRRRDNRWDGPVQRQLGPQDHMRASADPGFEVPTHCPFQRLRGSTRGSEASLDTMNMDTMHAEVPACCALADPPVTTNRLARFLLSTRH